MQIASIYDTEPKQWKSGLAELLRFIRINGERRITSSGYRILGGLTPDQLATPGVSLLIATVRGQNGRHLAGVSIVSDFGKEACLVAVHPLYRNRHTGTALLAGQLERLGRLECSVASDNIPGLKMCFNAGLAAVAFRSGPAGKPTLLFRSPQIIGNHTTLTQEGDILCQSLS